MSSSESESLSNTPSRQSSLKNSKIESKKDVKIIGNSMLNGINEEGLSDDRYKVKVKITWVQQQKTFVTLSNLKHQII